MYVATRELNLGKGRVAKAGDPIPEASEWEFIVLKAHMNLEWIKWVDEVAPQGTQAVDSTQRKPEAGKRRKSPPKK